MERKNKECPHICIQRSQTRSIYRQCTHINDRYYVSVTTGYRCVDIRRFYVPYGPVNVTCLSGANVDVILTLFSPDTTFSTRYCLSLRVNEESVGAGFDAAPTSSSTPDAAPATSLLIGISIVAIIIVVVF